MRNTFRVFTALLFCFLFFSGHAQTWPKIFGSSKQAHVRSIVEDYDKAIIIGGHLDRGGLSSQWVWLIKTDLNGDILWEKKLGDYYAYRTYLSRIINTADSGKIIAAATSKYSTDWKLDPAFIKLNVCGEIEWCQVLQSPGNNYGIDVIELENGGYVGLLKYYGGDITTVRISLVRMNENGQPLWIEHLAQEDPGINNEEGRFLLHTTDGKYLVAGDCSYGGLKAFWIKTDTMGKQIWDLKWSGHTLTASSQTIEAPGGGRFYATGAAAGGGHPISPALFKFDSEGNPIYQAYLLGDTIDGGEAWPLCQFNDTLLLHGVDWSPTGSGVDEGITEVLMTDTLGNLVNRRFLQESTLSPECIIKTHDDKIVVTSNYYDGSNWDIYMWKFNSKLENDSMYTQSYVYDNLCPYTIVSDTIDLNCSLHVSIDEIPTKEEYFKAMKVYPNPANDKVGFDFRHLKGNCILHIVDMFGREMVSVPVGENQEHIELDVSKYARGIYIAILKNEKKIFANEKFVCR